MSDILTDSGFIKADKAKSLTYFYKGKGIPFVDDILLKEIKRIAGVTGENLRLNLHSSPDDEFHSMIIFQWKGTAVNPHKHVSKSETYHLLEGSQYVVLFSDEGEVIENKHLSVNKTVIYRIPENTFHSTYIDSEYIIFHEAKNGPFLGEDDSLFAGWAPNDINEWYAKKFLGDN